MARGKKGADVHSVYLERLQIQVVARLGDNPENLLMQEFVQAMNLNSALNVSKEWVLGAMLQRFQRERALGISSSVGSFSQVASTAPVSAAAPPPEKAASPAQAGSELLETRQPTPAPKLASVESLAASGTRPEATRREVKSEELSVPIPYDPTLAADEDDYEGAARQVGEEKGVVITNVVRRGLKVM